MWDYVFFPTETVLGLSPFLIYLLLILYVSIRALILQGGIYYLTERTRFATKKVYGLPWSAGQLRKELIATVQIILFDGLIFTGLILGNFFRVWPDSLQADLITFAVAFIWLEIWFYVSHRLLHHKWFYPMHAQHHTAKVTSPLTALSFSFGERFILIGGGLLIPAVLSHFLPFSVTALAIYLLCNYLLNLYAHLNVEFIPARWLDYKLGRVLNTTTYHALHHARYRGHYGLFTPFMDRIFKTQFRDYREAHREASSGHSLRSLNQKFSASDFGSPS